MDAKAAINQPRVLTLCLITRGDEMLLGMKKRGFGAGKWNGFGGKLDPGETVEQALHREVLEETGLTIGQVEKKGLVRFEFQDRSDTHDVHIYECADFSGEPQETEEMQPAWFPKNNLPLTQMWPGDTYWLPTFLTGQKFRGRFVYDRPSGADHATKVIEQEIQIVQDLAE